LVEAANRARTGKHTEEDNGCCDHDCSNCLEDSTDILNDRDQACLLRRALLD